MVKHVVKYRVIASLLLAIVFIITGCAAKQAPESRNTGDGPPLPVVAAGDTGIPVTQGSYCWERTCADYPGPRLLLKEHLPTVITPDSSITIAFDYKPAPSQLHTALFLDEYEAQEITLTDGTFRAPKEPGIYYYSVSAHWMSGDGKTSKGSTTAAFVIEVKN